MNLYPLNAFQVRRVNLRKKGLISEAFFQSNKLLINFGRVVNTLFSSDVIGKKI